MAMQKHLTRLLARLTRSRRQRQLEAAYARAEQVRKLNRMYI